MASTFASTLKKPKRSKRTRLPDRSSIVIVGNGMVGVKFCEALVDEGIHRRCRITAIGDEPVPAYDRIKLSSYVNHRSSGELLIHTDEWYSDNDITLLTGKRITSINREARTVTDNSGENTPYDILILATGSRPFIPPIEGADLPGVFLYRNLHDLDRIISAASGKKSATVIGGGLLGLEAAQAIQKLGLDASIVERASFLMPQQLNATASKHLEEKVHELGIGLHLNKSSTVISRSGDRLELTFNDDLSCKTDLVIVSAGITPNSELAGEAGLPVGARGGVVVNAHLETEDPAIFAIGECALMHGRIWGLAAPGYAMARHLAKRLAGEKVLPLAEPDLSTRLKMLGAEVIIIGSALEEGTRHEFQPDDSYRLLLTGPKGELRGALGVGPWEEAGKIQSLFMERAIIREKEIAAFLETGKISTSSSPAELPDWPDSRIVCNCMNLSKGELVGCLAACQSDPDRLSKTTGAATLCGSCRPLLEQLCGASGTKRNPAGRRSLLVLSIIALFGVLITIFIPSPAMAESVQEWRYQLDQLWRNGLIKQVTGYTLTGIFTIGLLISLRKRIRWFRIGHFARWRVFHALFGVTSLIALFAHTGFRFGHNLNFWLMLTFVLLNLLGAAAGIVSSIEQQGTTSAALAARRLRPYLVYAHIILFWPLPILLTFHILSVYFY